MPTTPQQVDDYINTHVVPLLEKYGATVEEKFLEAHLTTPPGRIFTAMTFRYHDQVIALTGQSVQAKSEIEFLLKKWDDLQEVLTSCLRYTDPFFSDIYGQFQAKFGKRNLTASGLAIGYVCDQVRKSGKRIWT